MATLILNMETEIQPYIDALEASEDDLIFLEQMEANMIGFIEADTNWRFLQGSAGEVVYVNSRGGSRLWLPYRAITLTSVDWRPSLSSAWETVESTGYELSPKRTYLRRIDGVEWPEGEDIVRVTGTFGYAAADVPREVRQLLLEMLNWMYRRGRKAFGEQQVIAQMKKETNFDLILKRYRSPVYG